ncbi:transposase [Fodinibius sp.]|uniref:transposase n=1 Tax=Fodinibius sp. TaxID=1872440 RepID=UPI002ACD8AC4|nr:transposase [Fodinibius sp.]MDZ7658510.1 transposase [Fodinibius sp.]
MANEKQNYSADFKKEVAQKALDQSKQNLDKLSKKYDVPVSVILMWATELEKGGEDVFKTEEDKDTSSPEEPVETIDVEVTDEELANSVEHGVMQDKLNYKRLIFWSLFGTILVVIFVRGLYEMYEYNTEATQERVSSESEYYQVNQMKRQARQQLDSFGVVDLENGTYRIPIDSAINKMAADEE